MASFHGFDTVPAGATKKVEAFQLHVPESELADLKTLLKLSKIGPDTYENRTSTREGGEYFGITRDWLSEAKETWLDKFDWREHEADINSFPAFKVPIQAGVSEPLSVHFTALFSKKQDAIPVLFMHGWPGSFLEFLPMLEILRTKYTAETLPIHAVVPSLPGYGLSSGPPVDRDFNLSDTARAMNELMVALGFGGGYVAQGGDVGSALARRLSVAHDECKALHVNFLWPPAHVDQDNMEGVTEQELAQLKKYKAWKATGSAYAMEHATRPATIGLVLSASPLALLAWVGEKLLEWADTPIPMQTILRMISLYWFTSAAARNVYPYRALFAREASDGDRLISETKPLGYSVFQDLGIVPEVWCKQIANLKFRRPHSEGGHFAALEQPQAFLDDVEEFVLNVVGSL